MAYFGCFSLFDTQETILLDWIQLDLTQKNHGKVCCQFRVTTAFKMAKNGQKWSKLAKLGCFSSLDSEDQFFDSIQLDHTPKIYGRVC